MSLFSKRSDKDVPVIEVQGDEAVIPQPSDDPDEGESSERSTTDRSTGRKVKFPKRIWGRN